MSDIINRRRLLQVIGSSAGMVLLPDAVTSISAPKRARDFTYCLNMSTIRGHNLGFIKEIEVASKAGFRSIEIWLDSLQTYLEKGGSLKDAGKRLGDLGMMVEDAIGFAEWIVDDEDRRQKGLEQMKREMAMLAEIGCRRMAAPPMGATELPLLDLKRIAERYRGILDIGDQTGVVPHVELWGFSRNLGRASDVMYVALESGHPSARVLLDIFHLYKGESSLDTLGLISSSAIEVLHLNDYSANMPPATITDADRIYPGDGVAPIARVLKLLRNPQRPLVLSLEVFNKTYYQQDPLKVATTALAKMKAVTAEV